MYIYIYIYMYTYTIIIIITDPRGAEGRVLAQREARAHLGGEERLRDIYIYIYIYIYIEREIDR